MQDMIHKLLISNAIPFESSGMSMIPLIIAGDKIYFKKILFNEINIGDVLVIKKDKRYILHRVIYMSHNYVITKGDNSPRSDGKTYINDIVGKVYKVMRARTSFRPEKRYQKQFAAHLREIVKIKKELELAYIIFVFLKGTPLYVSLYKKYPFKSYSDCHILISSNDIPKIQTILIKFGYIKKSKNIYAKSINNFSTYIILQLSDDWILSQICQINMLYPRKLSSLFFKDLLSHVEKKQIGRTYFPFLAKEYRILYLSLQIFRNNYHGALQYAILDETIKKEVLTIAHWKQIRNLCFIFKLQNFVIPIFVVLKKYYKTPIPAFVTKTTYKVNAFTNTISQSTLCNDNFPISIKLKSFSNLYLLSPLPFWVKIWSFFSKEFVLMLLWAVSKKMSIALYGLKKYRSSQNVTLDSF